ncbi:MAG: hypothetical protein DCC65_12845 [Planctomycetota bacterium]|nr:MAG: hypothetical protein DCC65_12845 [Planctomycetota bacterium]
MGRLPVILACVLWQLSTFAVVPRIAAKATGAAPAPCCCCKSAKACQCGCETPAQESSPLPIEWVVCPCGDKAPTIPAAPTHLTEGARPIFAALALSEPADAVVAPVRGFRSHPFHTPPPDSAVLSVTTLLI